MRGVGGDYLPVDLFVVPVRQPQPGSEPGGG